MRNYDSEFAQEIAKEVLTMFYMVKLEFSTTHYYVDFDTPILYSGNLYSPFNFQFQDIMLSSQMSVDSVNIDFDDVEGVISYLALTEDIRGKVATIYLGVKLRPTNLIKNSTFVSDINGWEAI